MSHQTVDAITPQVRGKDEHENRAVWSEYKWPQGGAEWSRPWGGSASLWYSGILPRVWAVLPDAASDGRAAATGTIVEIACGHGRITDFLRRHAGRLIGVDVTPKCVEACVARFADDKRCEFHVNDGTSLPMVEDASADLVFSWDSLVHVGHEVMQAYVREIARMLKPGGYAFIHHSNLGQQAHLLTGKEKTEVVAGRRASMSAEKMRADCAEVGLVCESQELLPWNHGTMWLDCISVIRRPREGEAVDAAHEPRTLTRTDWGAASTQAIWTAWLYGHRRANEPFLSA